VGKNQALCQELFLNLDIQGIPTTGNLATQKVQLHGDTLNAKFLGTVPFSRIHPKVLQ
jgi:hypothetical protein